MGVRQMLDFFKEATTYIKPDPEALREAGDSAPHQLGYHRRIIAMSGFGAVVGAIAGIVMSVLMSGTPQAERDLKLLLLFPIIVAVVGTLIGTSISCLIAPEEFLRGPVGSKWMQLIGTKSVLVARIVCLIIGVIMPAALLIFFMVFPFKQ